MNSFVPPHTCSTCTVGLLGKKLQSSKAQAHAQQAVPQQLPVGLATQGYSSPAQACTLPYPDGLARIWSTRSADLPGLSMMRSSASTLHDCCQILYT